MISKLKRWIGRTAQIYNSEPVPAPIAHGSPFIQIYRIGNGYIVYKNDNRQYHDNNHGAVTYCATPMDVARQIVNDEALQKMGIDNRPQELQTTGRATGSFNKI